MRYFVASDDPVEYLSDEDYYDKCESTWVDFDLKMTAVKASRAVVRVDCYAASGKEWLPDEEQRVFSGTVVACEKGDDDDVWIATILTCATITTIPEVHKVAVYWEDGVEFEARVDVFDMYYNVALLTVYLERPLPVAILRALDVVDSIPSPLLSHHSTLRKIHLGDPVVSLARACDVRASLVAKFGEFSANRCKFGCDELLWSTCDLSPVTLGGPLLNGDGEVIGVNFESGFFLPINIVSRCLGCLKNHEKVNHPRLGMQLTNLHEVALETLKDFSLKFPDISAGVVVEEVEEGSFADQAGIRPLDIIVRCDEVTIATSLKLFDLFWDKTREEVKLIVKRASVGDTISLSMIVGEASPDDFDRWSTDGRFGVPHETFPRKSKHSLDSDDVGLDLVIKRCSDDIGESIVEIDSFREERRFLKGSGLMYHCEKLDDLFIVSVVTSACLLGDSFEDITSSSDATMVKVILFDGRTFIAETSAFDLHYNIVILTIKSHDQLPTTMLKSYTTSHCKGERVISLGRSNRILAYAGLLSIEDCQLDCNELWKATCKNRTDCIGGPLINVDGEVIGLNFTYIGFTPFLPVNIVLSCLDQLKTYGRVRHPWIGARIMNLHAAAISRLERIFRKFGEIPKGVMVDKVVVQSPAYIAGILPCDVIVQCRQEAIGCSMQFFKLMFDKAGEDVEMTVIRVSEDAPLTLTVHVAVEIPHGVNRWPVCSIYTRRKRCRTHI